VRVRVAVLCIVLTSSAFPGVASAQSTPAAPHRPASLLGVHSPFGDPSWPSRMAELLGGKGGWLVDVVYSTDPDWIAGQAGTFRSARARGHEPIVRIDYARPDGSAWADASWDRPSPAPGATIPPAGDVGWCLKRAPQPWERDGGPVRYADGTHLGCYLQFVDEAVPAMDAVHTWVIGNEMNMTVEAKGFPEGRIPAGWYASVYRAARSRIRGVAGHEADAVLVGGVAPGAGGPAYRSGQGYLSELLYVLHPRDIDGIALHAYGGYPGGTPSALDTFRLGIEPGMGYRDQAQWIDALGFSRTPLLVTEWSARVRADGSGQDLVARFVGDAARDLHEWNSGPANHAILGAAWFTWNDDEFASESIARYVGVRAAFAGAAAAYPAGDAAHGGRCWAPGGTRSRFFPETGHAVRGPFLDLWESRGGLAVFGYPIGEAGCLEDARTGRVLWSQWFQRHRMEYHPELGGTRYEVSLGAAGSLLAREHGIDPDDWTPQPQPGGPCALLGPGPGMGKWVCGDLLARFRATDLSAIGWPISAETWFRTRGGSWLVAQWFERARLERHPTGIEGGLLGCEQSGLQTVPGCQ
jgi:hypothetical protein